MAIVWQNLEKEITDWLEDLGEKTTDDTAKFFADSYASAVTAGAEPIGNAVIDPAKEAAIEQAWKAAFAQQAASDTPLGVPCWLPVATSIVLYWTGALFEFKIPHPGTVSGVSNLVTFPGAPPPIAAAIDKAFKQEEAPKVAKELVNGYKTHLSTVTGLFTGLTPPPASAPLPVPWAGIK
tara:strand:- start:50 stop:589 length:540 start_codon:yes stop_codon:yes gene_type:complete